jgi:hypothetical protein
MQRFPLRPRRCPGTTCLRHLAAPAFFSKQLRVAEQKYSAFDKELLALYLSTRHFRYYLKGWRFSAFTNHKPLTFAMANVSDPWSAWQQRHLAYISEFTTDVQHIASKDNPIADALSRTSQRAAGGP